MRAETQPVPPKIKAAVPSSAIFAAIVLGATAIGAGAMVFFFNPSTHLFYPVCLFHAVTGWNCPGCGMTRALYALLHGNLQLALKDNALFVLTLTALAVWGVRFAGRKMRGQPATLGVPPKFLAAFLGVALAFAVLRNLPAFAWLSP